MPDSCVSQALTVCYSGTAQLFPVCESTQLPTNPTNPVLPQDVCSVELVNFAASPDDTPMLFDNQLLQALQSLNCGFNGVTVVGTRFNLSAFAVTIDPINCALGAFTMFVGTGGKLVALACPTTINIKHAAIIPNKFLISTTPLSCRRSATVTVFYLQQHFMLNIPLLQHS